MPYPANTYNRFLICIAAPSSRGTGAGGISSHCNSGAGKSAKVAGKNLSGMRSFLSLTSSLYKYKLVIVNCSKIHSSRTIRFQNHPILNKYSLDLSRCCRRKDKLKLGTFTLDA